jgi:predicted Zn-dependent peptidase
METVVKNQIMPGVDLTCVHTEKFKTGILSITMMTELKKETASKTALIMRVLRRGTSSNPTMEDIAARLDELYGAKIAPTVRKKGEIACVGLYSSFPDDYYVDDGNILEKTASLMGEILLSPDTKAGLLRGDYVDSEKQNLIQDIRSLINEKAGYAVVRMTELMCPGEKYGVRILGSESAVKKITAAGLTKYYRELIARARVHVFYCGSADPEKVTLAVKSALAALPRQNVYEYLTTDVRLEPVKDHVREYREEMNVTQGKLVMGFRMGEAMTMPNYATLLVLNGVFGGCVTSKLFLNVREKMSLCYYASSAVEKHKGIMLVSSGVDPSNGETAKNEILRQLDAVKNGEIEDWELDGAKGTYVTLLRSYMDEPYGMENFYLDNCLTGLTVTPEEMAGLVDCVTKEEVVAAAGGIKADCVYFLTARESEKEPENEA